MIKLLLISSVVLTGLISNSFSHPVSKANEGSDLKAAIQAFVSDQDGKYTKKTEIRLNDAAVTEAAEYFHAGANTLKRRTYYDETVDALLMGDYGGGFENIKSGYVKNGSNMDHYFYSGTGESAADFFTPKAEDVNYTVQNTTPNAFFVNLSSIANEVNDKTFVKAGDVYTYTVPEGGLVLDENGDYADVLLHKVQFFAVPMFLQGVNGARYISPSTLVFDLSGADLRIEFHCASDTGKIKDGTSLLAECIVSKGLILD